MSVPLSYKRQGLHWRGREKGVDVRIAIDLLRLAQKGLHDVAIVLSEDSDLNEAIRGVYELRDYERWIAVENALPTGQRGVFDRWRVGSVVAVPNAFRYFDVS